MHGPDRISDLVEDIYDAALEPALWADVVVRINSFVGGRACGLFSKDPISKSGVTHYYCGADPHYIRTYAETYSQFDPLTKLPPLGEVVSIPDLVAFDEYRAGPFYQEWLRPQGCVDAANVVLEQTRSSRPVLMTVLSGRRMVDQDMRRRLGMIVPHARRALAINKAIDVRMSEAATFASVLDAISSGIFLIGENCRLIHANVAAQNMIAADDFLRIENGRLLTGNNQTNQTLRQSSRAGAGAALSRGAAFLLTGREGQNYVAHLLPLTAAARGTVGANYKASAALFVRKAELDSEASASLIACKFELTPAELRVLLAVIDVGGVPDTAKALGIAETTVKTHLHRVFSKTGTTRQADLVKLAAEFSNPLMTGDTSKTPT